MLALLRLVSTSQEAEARMSGRPATISPAREVVEFALVLPLVLVVVLGLVQVGLVVRDRLLVEAAARAGARGKL